ncbi:hypothetical protein WDU94_014668 [Cyamophila willieti]
MLVYETQYVMFNEELENVQLDQTNPSRLHNAFDKDIATYLYCQNRTKESLYPSSKPKSYYYVVKFR